ncbi:MAG: phenylalanine--tRNA ligase subunit beta [candidate division WOR-3 bacterium]
MKISLRWLNDFVKVDDIDPFELSQLLTMKTAETEGVYSKNQDYSNIYTCEILEAVKIDEKHFKCRVVSDKEYTVISGAPNTRKGLKTFHIKPGGKLDGETITTKSFSGEVSEGMLLSGKELGINNDHSGLFELPHDIKTGIEIGEFTDYYDYVIEIDNKSLTHRPDLWGIFGFSREIKAILGRDNREPKIFDKNNVKDLPEFPIEIIDREKCYRYVGVKIGNIKVEHSPLNIQIRLSNTGHVPRNIIVDLTNYVMTEIGQPLHAFDGNSIKKIVVDSAKEDFVFKTLDKVDRKLPKGILLIKNEDTPVAIAGIMGGGNSDIRDDSQTLFLESANFDASHIRKMSTRISLRTDSSARFEKSLDPENALIGCLRYVQLLKENQKDIKIESSITDKNYNPFKRNVIYTDYSYIKKTIGIEIENERIKSILKSLEFEVEEDKDRIKITAPTYRSTKDISIKEDIVEEVVRIYGFDNVKPVLPKLQISATIKNVENEKDNLVKDLLTYKYNLNEVDSHPWYDDKFNKKIGFKTGGEIEIKNPITIDNKLLRTTLLPTLLKFSFENLKYFDQFALYEIGKTFHQNTEIKRLGIISVDKKIKNQEEKSFFKLKSILNDIFERLTGKEPVYRNPTEHQLINPSISADIYFSLDDKNYEPVGYLGIIHPKINSLLDKKVVIAFTEIEIEKIYGFEKSILFKQFSTFPQTILDFSILKNKKELFIDFEQKIKEFKNELVKDFKIYDIYSGENILEGFESVTVRFTIGSDQKTLTGEEISEFQNQFIQFIKDKGYTLRS